MTDEELLHRGFYTSVFSFIDSGQHVIRKHFANTTEGHTFFATEKLARDIFHTFSWFPTWKAHSDRTIIMETYPQEHRLDNIAKTLTNSERQQVLGKLMSAILDLYVIGFAHRDLHTENIFYHDDRIIIIDYAFMAPYPDERPPFFECYDITGTGLASPYNTRNVCFLKKGFAASVSGTLNTSLDEAKHALRETLVQELGSASATFHSKAGRHLPSVFRPYSSFTLPGLTVSPEKAQRDSTRRLQKFSLNKEDLQEKTLLDLGSHCGGMLFESQKFQPRSSVGVEYDPDKVHIAKKIVAFNDLKNIRFMQADIDQITMNDLKEQADVVYCLSLVAHLKGADRLYELLGNVTKELLLFEGNARTNGHEARKKLLAAGFKRVDFLGYCDDDAHPAYNCRPVFKAWK